MKTLTQEEFNTYWKIYNEETEEKIGNTLIDWIADSIPYFTGGKICFMREKELDEHQVFFGIIYKPKNLITDKQLCQIFDEGNHCISEGKITYEDEYAYFHWSNKGHI